MTVRCPACGASSSADDQFCGVCGSALPQAAAPANTEPDRPVPIVGRGASQPVQAPPEPMAGPTRACGVCGAQNEAARTFCRVCGSTLTTTAASRAPGPTVGQGTAGATSAAAQPSQNARSAPKAPSARAAAAAAKPRSSGSGWMVILAALGLLAGILIILLPTLLGSRPVTEAAPSTSRPAATGTLPEAVVPGDVPIVSLPVPLVGTALVPEP